VPVVNIADPLDTAFSVGTASVAVTGSSAFHTLLYSSDLSNIFFNTAEFAETIRYFHSTLSKWGTYSAMYDDPHMSFSVGSVATINNVKPQLMLAERELLHRVVKGDYCIVRSLRYYVDDFIKDGVGVTTIFLRDN